MNSLDGSYNQLEIQLIDSSQWVNPESLIDSSQSCLLLTLISFQGVLNDQNVVAIKKLRSEPRLGWAHTYNQLLLASKLQHRNIVKVLGYTHEDEDTSFLAWLRGRKSRNRETRYIWVEEYMPMGNLHDIIYNQGMFHSHSSIINQYS